MGIDWLKKGRKNEYRDGSIYGERSIKRSWYTSRNKNAKHNRIIKAKNTMKKRSKNKIKKGFRIWKFLFWTFIISVVLGMIAITAVFAYFAKDLPDPNKINRRVIAESTKIYDRTGEQLLYEIYGEEKRTVIPFEEMPKSVLAATVALEDRSFYDHLGVDFKGLLRAALKNVQGDRQGASTITQQLVKNSILTSERSLERKVKEVILSLMIERKFSKNDILRMYLNEIPYGHNAYGIESASQTFFGKHAKDLSLAQSALLACLPNKPGRYSPTGVHTDKLLIRWRYALDSMAEMGFITPEQAKDAKKEDILSQVKPRRIDIKAPHFVFYIIDKLMDEFDEEDLKKQGLKVYTTLDMDMQEIAERVVKEGVAENGPKYGFSNSALLAANPKNGEVLAMVGSKDYFADDIDGKVNVTISKRQPGSSFKPYAYAQALSMGYTPETILFDVKTNFGKDGSGEYYRPQNYTGTFRGPVQLKSALATSLNIPAVKILYLAGIKNVIKLAKSMGITTLNHPENYGLALVLGGAEVKLIDHVGAFGVFANDGVKANQKVFTKIEDAQGNVISDFSKVNKKEVLDKNIARQIAKILSDNKLRTPAFGSSNPLVIPEYQVMAKTGTTNDYRDGWLLGASPTLVAGVWSGNNDNHSMRRGSAGTYVAAPIWHNFMVEALERIPKEEFAEPEAPDDDEMEKIRKIEREKPILFGKLEMRDKVRVCKYDDGKYCLANSKCPDKRIEKKKFFVGHSILYYVDRDDPLGDTPKNPEKDPQFKKWEEAVREWGKKHEGGSKKRAIPTRECKKSDF
jgi:1A family penicillin-binding protein